MTILRIAAEGGREAIIDSGEPLAKLAAKIECHGSNAR